MNNKPSKPILIFGTSEMGEVAQFYFDHDTERQVAAFVIDGQYMQEATFNGLPVIPFEDVMQSHPPSNYEFFIAVGFNKVNRIRKEKFLSVKEKGYHFACYISSKATVWTDDIGENCFILEANVIQPFVSIGNNVTLWSGNHIGHHCVIEDHCFITSHVVVSGKTQIKEGTFIGVNATLRDNITIGKHCIIGAGTIILKDTPENTAYVSQQTPIFIRKADEFNKL